MDDNWGDLLDALDRQEGWRFDSPDRATLAELMRVHDIPGLGIAVRSAGPPWAAGYGVTTSDGGSPVGPHTAFQACSISKHVAAVGALRLVERGVLDLDVDVDAYLTSWRLPDADGWRPVITVRHLLAHTAGLSYNWFRGYDPGAPLPTTVQTLTGAAPATSPPVRPAMVPGTRFRYSGAHYAVLEQLLVDVTGVGFAELLRELVLDPFGMSDSGFEQDFPATARNPVALGHHLTGARVRGGYRVQPELAGAGLWTTAADLTKLGAEVLAALAGKSGLLTEATAAAMTTAQVPGGFGLGTAVTPTWFGHTGGNVGYCCWLASWPDAGVSMAVLTNNDMAEPVARALLTLADRRYAPPVPETGEADPVGVYRFGHVTAEVAAAPAGLTIAFPGQPPIPLRPQAGGGYRAAGLDTRLAFRADAAELTQQDQATTGERC